MNYQEILDECAVLNGMLAENKAKLTLTKDPASISVIEADVIEIVDRLNLLEQRLQTCGVKC